MDDRSTLYAGLFLAFLVILILALALLWTPVFGPWSQMRRGLADLREAEQNRLILVEQAMAQKKVAVLQAEAERDAARLRAEAIAIVGDAAQQYPEYRQQEFIGAFADALRNGNIAQMVYVPTEAGIPILEAGRIGGR